MEGRFNGGFFALPDWGGIIHGGAYFRNFSVRKMFSLLHCSPLLDPPLLDSSYPRNRTIAEGSNLTLHCKVTAANPAPNITWYSFTSNNTALSHGVNLTFINTSRNHAGKYYCVVDNGIYGALTSSASTVDVQCE